jgi:hypothetical protein
MSQKSGIDGAEDTDILLWVHGTGIDIEVRIDLD